MCGIVGYVGQKQALEIIVSGLRRLEYRGYDSAGVAVIASGSLDVRKKAGKLTNLETLLGADPLPDSTTGIGHTRWATHGGPTDRNAHPHVSEDGSVAIIHNGIIENFTELREELTNAGVKLRRESAWVVRCSGNIADSAGRNTRFLKAAGGCRPLGTGRF